LLEGLSGADKLFGGPGADWIKGEFDDDELAAGFGSDIVVGGNFQSTGGYGQTNTAFGTFDSTDGAIVDLDNDTFTFEDHGYENDTKLLYEVLSDGTEIGGLTSNTFYYVIKTDSDKFQLKKSPGDGAINLEAGAKGDHVLTDKVDSDTYIIAMDFAKKRTLIEKTLTIKFTGITKNNGAYGTFKLIAGGKETADIQYSKNMATTIQTALNALTDVSGVTVTKEAADKYKIVFGSGIPSERLTLDSDQLHGADRTVVISAAFTGEEPKVTRNLEVVYDDADPLATPDLKTSISFQADSANVVDVENSKIKIANHGFETGDAVLYSDKDGTAIEGLTDGKTYYVKQISASEFQLADHAGVQKGGADQNVVNLTKLGDGLQQFSLRSADFDRVSQVESTKILDNHVPYHAEFITDVAKPHTFYLDPREMTGNWANAQKLGTYTFNVNPGDSFDFQGTDIKNVNIGKYTPGVPAGAKSTQTLTFYKNESQESNELFLTINFVGYREISIFDIGLSTDRTTAAGLHSGYSLSDTPSVEVVGAHTTKAVATVSGFGISDDTFIVYPGTDKYDAQPTPVIRDAGDEDRGTTADALMGVSTESFTVTGGNKKYEEAPRVIVGGGSGAFAVEKLNSAGKVSSVKVMHPGSGFDVSKKPTLTFVGGKEKDDSGDTAPTADGNKNNFVVAGISINDSGSGYTGVPTVVFEGAPRLDNSSPPTGAARPDQFVIGGLDWSNNGAGYTKSVEIRIFGGPSDSYQQGGAHYFGPHITVPINDDDTLDTDNTTIVDGNAFSGILASWSNATGSPKKIFDQVKKEWKDLIESSSELTDAEKTAAKKAVDDLNIETRNLAGNRLATLEKRGSDYWISVDQNAAGQGWYVDGTPDNDTEFTDGKAKTDGPAYQRYDLLSLLRHEIGHRLGLEHTQTDGELMELKLDIGERKSIQQEDADTIDLDHVHHGDLVTRLSTEKLYEEGLEQFAEWASKLNDEVVTTLDSGIDLPFIDLGLSDIWESTGGKITAAITEVIQNEILPMFASGVSLTSADLLDFESISAAPSGTPGEFQADFVVASTDYDLQLSTDTLTQIGLDISSFASIEQNVPLNVEAAIDIRFVFGVDASGYFFVEDPSLVGRVSADHDEPIDLSLLVGPLGIGIEDGTLKFDAGIVWPAKGRYGIGEFDNFEISTPGFDQQSGYELNLPIELKGMFAGEEVGIVSGEFNRGSH
ncbi:MAG: matrixin family metalloprotease, partial [Planctomycetota bacterium]|nr:matrixin family metalloprotease [Planctomycetota bacterium]